MATIALDGTVVTPEGTPLGGWVHVEVSDTGHWKAHFHMHSSSILGSFDFGLRAYLEGEPALGLPVFAFASTGSVSGVDDWDHREEGHDSRIAAFWPQLSAGPRLEVAKDWEWGGVIGDAKVLAEDLFQLGAGALGVGLGVVIGLTSEAIGWLDTTIGPGGTIGVLAGVVVFAFGGGLILAVTAGAAVGTVVDELVEHRPMNAAEIAVARQVFGSTLATDDVVLTNLTGLGDRPFAAPGVDGKTYLNMGSHYADPIGSSTPSYPVRGQLLVHELVHAWQIQRAGFLPGLMCAGLVNQARDALGEEVYGYGAPGPDWESFNLEQQASIIDDWFGGTGKSTGHAPMSDQNPYFRYVDQVAARQGDWRFCTKCTGLFFDGYPTKGACPGGGEHTADGYRFLLFHHGSGVGQDHWRYCTRCGGMFYDGYPDKGICPATGPSEHRAAGFVFTLPHGGGDGQNSWRFCTKCTGMFYDGYPTKGTCPAGAGHEAAGYDFHLPHGGGNGQSSWRFCAKCSGMFFDGYPTKGTCPGGGGHEAAGYDFHLPHGGGEGQTDWRFCAKCGGLFFDGYPTKGVCPQPGPASHRAEGYDFVLQHGEGAGQPSWRFCAKCSGMFFDGYPTKGACPAGGGHEAAGHDFRLHHAGPAPSP